MLCMVYLYILYNYTSNNTYVYLYMSVCVCSHVCSLSGVCVVIFRFRFLLFFNFLGLILDSTLNWKAHLKANKNLSAPILHNISSVAHKYTPRCRPWICVLWRTSPAR